MLRSVLCGGDAGANVSFQVVGNGNTSVGRSVGNHTLAGVFLNHDGYVAY